MDNVTDWYLSKLFIYILLVIFNCTSSEKSKCQEPVVRNHRCSISCYDISEFKSDFIEKEEGCSWELNFKTRKFKEMSLTEDFFHGEFDDINIDKISFLYTCIKKIKDDFLKPIFNDESEKSKHFWSLSITYSNCLYKLEEDIFKQIPYLKHLDLSYNKIKKISDDAFTGLHMLDILKLNNNNIKIISKKLLAPLTSLKSLDLSANNIIKIHSSAFKSLVRLEQLKLNRNEIKILEKGIFEQFQSLHTLDLSNNRLEIFSPDFLSDYCRESIKTLYLNNNNLKTLSSKVLDFKNLNPSHLDISLSDNLWNCDHQLAWIKSLSVFIREKSIKCYMPPKFKGVTIDKISLVLLQNSNVEKIFQADRTTSTLSFRDEIIGVSISVLCVFLFLGLLYTGYRNRWCTKPAYWENNRAEFVKTEVDADEESEMCIIYIEEADKGNMITA